MAGTVAKRDDVVLSRRGILRHGNVAINSVVINDDMTSEAHFNGLEAWEEWIFRLKFAIFQRIRGMINIKPHSRA